MVDLAKQLDDINICINELRKHQLVRRSMDTDETLSQFSENSKESRLYDDENLLDLFIIDAEFDGVEFEKLPLVAQHFK